MRIHHITNSFALQKGGAQRLVQQLHAGLRAKGIESFVLGLEAGCGERVENATSLDLRSPYHWKALRGVADYFRNHCREGDLIHAHLFPTNLYCSVAKRTTAWRGAMVATEHNTSNRRRGKTMGRIIDFFTYRGYDRIACISEGTQQELNTWKPGLSKKTCVIQNGSRLPFTHRIVRNGKVRPLIVSVGRLEDQKNYERTLYAIAMLNDLTFDYYIAGTGGKDKALAELCQKLGLNEKITFLGYCSDVPSLLKKADIFLIPSQWEGFGLAAVEAMNASLPIVAGNVAGLREVVNTDPACGLLVDPNSPEGIAAALRKLINDSSLRDEMGENGFVTSKQFSEDRMVHAYITFYKDVLNRDGVKRSRG